MQNDYPVISKVERTPASPVCAGRRVGVNISAGINYYNVIGANLDKIASVQWNPRNRASIRFNMIPLVLYDGTSMGRFGIIILDNYYNASDRGGYLSFLRSNDGTMIQWPAITYGNLGLVWKGPYSGLREFGT